MAGSGLSPTVLLLALQIGTRLFTFIINQASIRWSDPSIYGAAHIHLELLLSVVLFLSREGIRGASLRRQSSKGSTDEDKTNVASNNLSLLPIPLGIALASIALPLFLRTSTDLASQPYFTEVIYLYLASSLLELAAEPLYLHALSPQGGRDISLRVRAEALAAIAKGVVTLLGLVSLDEKAGLLAFGLGQLAYGSTALATFWLSYIGRIGLRPTFALYILQHSHTKSEASSSSSSSETSRLALSLTVQSFFKHLLTEADKVAVSRLASLEDQGGYALGTNYASLPLRLLFQPLEESSRFQFSKDLGGAGTGEHQGEEAEVEETVTPEIQNTTKKIATASSRARKTSSYNLLHALLHLHSFLGLFLLAFLPPLSSPFILLLSGPQWLATSAPRTLAAYAVFLPVLGWSGILEGFLQSTAGRDQLRRYNGVILGSSATFGASLWGLTRVVSTEEALVLASAAAMAVRAAYGWRHAREEAFFPQLSLGGLRPSLPTLCALGFAAIVTRATSVATADVASGGMKGLASYAGLVGTAVTTGVGCLGVVYLFDRRSLTQALSALNAQRAR
ncbi:Rft-1-domain-containing protein [Jaminaea rosea]|uniref:Man(5)GlcNAc(2)-PP-dolichol translocation protein RFT1 n=1 Tax=Jaminaea rosea TaxID=1569628 RepID=A0A316UUS1_9BASI|nr:Rft-1-domain-containing protein [Jaminaea rosea]PWN28528.1 Rft-1-domain-containing protein [Jaminaea rosea]